MDTVLSWYQQFAEVISGLRDTVGANLRFALPHWIYWGGLLVFPLFFLVMVRWYERRQAVQADAGPEPAAAEPSTDLDRPEPGNGLTRVIDRLSIFTGSFVAYWTIIAVFVYFYEVVARYILNAPTNWAHESMFLMFGMQYILAGAYAYHYDAHVRVDLFYVKASRRKRAGIDIMTSFAFLIFVLGFTVTSWTFFSSSMNQNGEFWGIPQFWASGYSNEVSFTEWAVAYYPVKFSLVVGGILLGLQGLSRLIKDIQVFVAYRGRDDVLVVPEPWDRADG